MIIIKINSDLKLDSYHRLRKFILKQKETGVIVLPHYCTVEYADDNTEIRVEDKPSSNISLK